MSRASLCAALLPAALLFGCKLLKSSGDVAAADGAPPASATAAPPPQLPRECEDYLARYECYLKKHGGRETAESTIPKLRETYLQSSATEQGRATMAAVCTQSANGMADQLRAAGCAPDGPSPSATASTASMPSELHFTTYKNGRFCFEVDIPLGMVADPPSEIGDGQSWKSRDGTATISAAGVELVTPEMTLDYFFAEDSKDNPAKGRKVTLKAKSKDAYTVSGFEGDKVFYSRGLFTKTSAVNLKITYLKSSKDWWDRAVTHMAKSFKRGC